LEGSLEFCSILLVALRPSCKYLKAWLPSLEISYTLGLDKFGLSKLGGTKDGLIYYHFIEIVLSCLLFEYLAFLLIWINLV